MTITRLSLYNGACRLLGENKLASVTEAVEVRYLLDDVWDDGAIDSCLEEGLWNFAMRTAGVDYDQSISPNFGFIHAFAKPTDWIRTAGTCSDPYFYNRLTDLTYKDEAGYWYADLDTMYVRYVSNDSSYGNNLSLWPQSFNKFVQSFFALAVVPKLRDAQSKQDSIEKIYRKFRLQARSKDAMNEGAAFPQAGTWVSSRFGRGRGRFDGGNPGSLIG